MSKDHAYAYEAGYRDGSVHYELEHCPACKNIADLQEALEENDKLRKDLEFANNEWEKDSIEFLNLQAENATLRQQLADVTESMGRVEERCAKTLEVGKRWMAKAARFEAENAKLRELVSVMPRCWNADCDGCPMAVGKTVYGYGFGRCVAKDKLRELGVEVDG